MGNARDEPALQRLGPRPERHEPVGRSGEQPRPGDQVGAARRPRARRTHRPSSRSRNTAAVSPRRQLPRQATCRTATPLPSAARRASATSRLPGRGSACGSSARRQEEQTSTVTSPAARGSPSGTGTDRRLGVVTRHSPCPGDPPGGRTTRRDGRSPGSRIAAPWPPSRDASQWPLAGTTAYSCGYSCGLAASTGAPHSLPPRGGPSPDAYGRPRAPSTRGQPSKPAHRAGPIPADDCGLPPPPFPLTCPGRRFPRGNKRECGADPVQSRGCPRNCKRRAGPGCHWGASPGKVGQGRDPRARRPAAGAAEAPTALGWRAKGQDMARTPSAPAAAPRPPRSRCSALIAAAIGALHHRHRRLLAHDRRAQRRPRLPPLDGLPLPLSQVASHDALRNMLFVAALAGLAVGVAMTLHAVLRHRAADPRGRDLRDRRRRSRTTTAPPPAAPHDHDAEAWAPADGFQRMSLHRRRQPRHRDRLRPAARRRLRVRRRHRRLAPGPALGPRRLRRLHPRPRPRPAAGASGHARGRARRRARSGGSAPSPSPAPAWR